MLFRNSKWAGALSMAPVLAERARRLSSRTGDEEAVLAEPVPEAVSMIEMRVHWLERRMARLSEDASASLEIVNAMTDQHSALVRAVDALLARTLFLAGACAVLAAVAVSLGLVVLLR